MLLLIAKFDRGKLIYSVHLGPVPSPSRRHTSVIWDMGHGLEHPQREWLARASYWRIVLTVTVWTIAYLVY
jgi:hypothetical protein